MGDSGSSGYRDLATGVLSGFAALATAAAGVLGVLHEAGYLGSRATTAPAAIATSSTLAQPAQVAPVSVALNSTSPIAPSISSADAQASPVGAVPNLATNHEHHRIRPHRPVSPPETVAANAPGNAAALAPRPDFLPPQPRTSEPPRIALSGAWTDFGPGYCHAIKQTGNRVEVVNFAPVTNTFISVGHGTVSGRSVHLEMNDRHPFAAVGDMILSDDGMKLLGTLKRQDGEHPLVWHRKGSPCG